MRELNRDLTLDRVCLAHAIVEFPLVAFKRHSSARVPQQLGRPSA